MVWVLLIKLQINYQNNDHILPTYKHLLFQPAPFKKNIAANEPVKT
jgi:hypothetical protein